MQTIKEPVKNISLIWRHQTPEKTVYRPMKYLLKAQAEDGTLLYNVVTSEMILLDSNEAKVFESLPAMYSPEMDELIARHYVVKEDFEERKSVQQLRALLKKLNPSKRVTGFTILPTTECNARCYYCFESDYKRCTMTKEIVSDVVDYIAKVCKGEPVEISWFGGEPLVGKKIISQICEGLKQKGIAFKSSMVSNAYLFDENLIKTAKEEWALSNVQITLDGTEAVYNETKAYVNPKDNPYKRVLKNIDDLLNGGISVSIRLNVSNKNIDDLKILIDELAERFSGRKGLGVYSHAVYEDVGFDPLNYDDSARELVDEQTIAIDTKLREKGLLGSLAKMPYLRYMNCMADNDSCRIIYPDGIIGKCENRSSEDGIGDIYHDITNEKMDAWYKTANDIPDCYECCLYPYCMNLSFCPETGKCSRNKKEWKTNRYAGLMQRTYLKYKNNGSDVKEEDPTLAEECES